MQDREVHKHILRGGKKRNSRYLRRTLHHPLQIFWAQIYHKGDDFEFLHFTGYT